MARRGTIIALLLLSAVLLLCRPAGGSKTAAMGLFASPDPTAPRRWSLFSSWATYPGCPRRSPRRWGASSRMFLQARTFPQRGRFLKTPTRRSQTSAPCGPGRTASAQRCASGSGAGACSAPSPARNRPGRKPCRRCITAIGTEFRRTPHAPARRGALRGNAGSCFRPDSLSPRSPAP